MSNTASPKQIDFINSLQTQRDVTGVEASAALQSSRNAWEKGQFTKQVASNLIDILKAQPYADSAEQGSTPDGQEAPEGMHQVDGVIFKVQVAKQGSGRKYAKRLVHEEGERSGWEYAPGAIRNLSENTRMTPEQAARYGALYGVCVNCGADLTDERSVYAGYGPVCAQNNGCSR